MPKVKVDRDALYPNFKIADHGLELDLTDEELAFIQKAQDDYAKAQLILAKPWTK